MRVGRSICVDLKTSEKVKLTRLADRFDALLFVYEAVTKSPGAEILREQ